MMIDNDNPYPPITFAGSSLLDKMLEIAGEINPDILKFIAAGINSEIDWKIKIFFNYLFLSNNAFTTRSLIKIKCCI